MRPRRPPKGSVIAESDDIVKKIGYHYFPISVVRMEWLPKTDSDRACPHGVQFYDVVIDGNRLERAAWTTRHHVRACNTSPAASASGTTSR